jgi:large subunit ribosomal protein L1
VHVCNAAHPFLHSKQRVSDALPISDALDVVLTHAKEGKPRKFVESVDLALKLGVDPRKPNQSVRGVQTLPHGTGKKVRVAVFARGQVKEAGARAGSSQHLLCC